MMSSIYVYDITLPDTRKLMIHHTEKIQHDTINIR